MAEKQNTEFHDCEDQEEVEAFLEKVEAGDALEFRKTKFYNHWGICIGRNYVGEVEVVHITAPENTPILMASMAACGSAATEKCAECLENIGKPFKEPLRYVMSKQSFVRVNNSTDDYVFPFSVDVILKRVKKTLRDGGWGCYHFALNNCEHYVNYCRNGNHVSLQSLEKGRQTLTYLTNGVKRIAQCSPTPEIRSIFAPAETVLTAAVNNVTETERQFRGQLETVNYRQNGKSLQDIETGRLTLGGLAAGAKIIAECAPTPEIVLQHVASGARTVLTHVKEYVGKRASRVFGKMEVETYDGEDSIEDQYLVNKDEFNKAKLYQYKYI